MTSEITKATDISETATDSERQLVVFQLAGEDYGVDTHSVQRLIQVPPITSVPQSPELVAGVIDVRGDIIPVINLKRRFGFGDTQFDAKANIVITDIGGQIVGFLVDGVSEVTRLAAEDVEPPSAVVSRGDSDTTCIVGIGKQQRGDEGSRLIKLLDIEKLLAEDEQAHLKTVSEQPREEAVA